MLRIWDPWYISSIIWPQGMLRGSRSRSYITAVNYELQTHVTSKNSILDIRQEMLKHRLEHSLQVAYECEFWSRWNLLLEYRVDRILSDLPLQLKQLPGNTVWLLLAKIKFGTGYDWIRDYYDQTWDSHLTSRLDLIITPCVSRKGIKLTTQKHNARLWWQNNTYGLSHMICYNFHVFQFVWDVLSFQLPLLWCRGGALLSWNLGSQRFVIAFSQKPEF